MLLVFPDVEVTAIEGACGLSTNDVGPVWTVQSLGRSSRLVECRFVVLLIVPTEEQLSSTILTICHWFWWMAITGSNV
ncbi:unnamed protein product [Dibothriocephalus latus]|uniref:Uncharacterized protein n=1 Tax=Dibothriocephalus latus TaxID=60516 RepID=A0A3P6T437_DIBLA|nr:unnamed protein product [Dibothriocephalus latus]